MSTTLEGFGDYVVLGELGRGGMGVVYQARHAHLNRPVALKIIRPEMAAGVEAERRFRREAEAAAALDHPHIVPVYEVGVGQGRIFLAMKLLSGGTLAEQIQEPPPPVQRVAEWMVQIAQAVEHAHRHGVLHRDIKPANILLDEAGQVYLSDFGLAKLRDETHQLTATQTTLGTPAFLAPEVATGGPRAATTAADIYSLGVVLYQLLTGQLPFPGESAFEVLEKVKQGTLVAPRQLNPGIPRDLELICQKCLRHEASQRYASAGELAADLERFLRGELISARQPGAGELFWFWVKRHRITTGFVLALLFSLLAGFCATFWQWRRAELFLADSRAANRQLAANLARRDQREAETLFSRRQSYDALKILARMVHDDPANSLAATRLFAALTETAFAWPDLPPLRHEAEVLRGGFTSDDRWIVTSSLDGFVHIWERGTGLHHRQFPHEPAWGQFALSADGGRVATMSSNGLGQVWRLQDGKLLFTQPEESRIQPSTPPVAWRPIKAMDFSSNGVWLAGGGAEGAVRLWRLSNGQLEAAGEHGEPVQLVSFHPRSQQLLTLGLTYGRLWNLTQDPNPKLLPGPKIPLAAEPVWAEFSSSGDKLLTVATNLVETWVTANGQFLSRATNAGSLNHASFSRDGLKAGLASVARRAQIVDLKTGSRTTPTLGHSRPVNTACFSPNGARLLTACEDGTARLWVVANGRPSSEAYRHQGNVHHALFSPDGGRVLTCSADHTARLWFPERALLREFPLALASKPLRYEFSPDGNLLAAVETEPALCLFSAIGNLQVRFQNHTSTILCLAFSADSRWLASGDEAGQVFIASAQERKVKEGPLALGAPVRQLKWSADGQVLAAATTSNVWFYRTSVGREGLRAWPVPQVSALDFSPDSQRLAVASANGGLWLGDSRAGQLPRLLPDAANNITFLRFSPDGKRMVAAGNSRAVQVWDVSTGQLVKPGLTTGGEITCLAFSPDSRRLLLGLRDGVVGLWDLENMQPQEFVRHQVAAVSAAFSPDGQWLATGDGDGFARFYHLGSGLPAAGPAEVLGLANVAFSTDGRTVLLTTQPRPGRLGDYPAARLFRFPAAGLPDTSRLLAMAELVLGQRVSDQAVWQDLKNEEFTARQMLAEPYSRSFPPVQWRSFRAVTR